MKQPNTKEENIKVLIVDDTKNNVLILINFLEKRKFTVITAENGQEGVDVAKAERPDIILMDIMMPVMNGYDACRAIKKDEATMYIPVIFVSAKGQQEDIVNGFQAGGDDFIQKPFFFEEILHRIKVHAENKIMRERLFLLSMTDPLTDLWNRRFFTEQAVNNVAHSLRYTRELSFAILDIDDFKSVNDSYGHDVGDLVLKHVSGVFKTSLRSSDLLCRWGGEEFVFLLPETKRQAAALVIERIRKKISAYPVCCEQQEIIVTMSGGISAIQDLPDDSKSFDTLCNIADKRLYTAKQQGKDRIIYK